MDNRLVVDSDDVRAASLALGDQANAVALIQGSLPGGHHESCVGAANVTAAIHNFGSAYTERLAYHARSMGAAASAYERTDDESAASLRTESI